ncbi:hypothetical protein BOX15_Mlig002838g2, partial [Macrostomum lignano]
RSEMSKFKSPTGETQLVNARRTEALDAPHIEQLITEETVKLFGQVSVVEIIEKALLAVVLSNQEGEIIAHAAFFDYPNKPSTSRTNYKTDWESWLSASYDVKGCNSLNSFFLHLFVAKEGYEIPAAEEIIRTAFNAVPDLHHIFMVVNSGTYPNAALDQQFSQCELRSGGHHPSDCTVFGLPRHAHVPTLHIRPALVEDHDDLTPIFNQQSEILTRTYGEYFLAELIAGQDDSMRCLACEVKGKAVGFMSVTSEINLDLLNQCYELAPFHGLRKPHPDDQAVPPRTPTPADVVEDAAAVDARPTSSQRSGSAAGSEKGAAEGGEAATGPDAVETAEKLSDAVAASAKSSLLNEDDDRRIDEVDEENAENEAAEEAEEEPEEEEDEEGIVMTPIASPKSLSPEVPPNTAAARVARNFQPVYHGESNAVVIQLFAIAEAQDPRSVDFLPHVFRLFPDADFAIITVPTMVPEFSLLQSFVRVTPKPNCTLNQELYVFHRGGLACNLEVRAAKPADRPSVARLVNSLRLKSSLLKDFDLFLNFKRDPVKHGEQIQAFVAHCLGQLVGVGIMRKEADSDAMYMRSHYNIEDFIYYNHHRKDEHARLYHLAVNPIFNHFSKLFIKEIMRLGDKTCLSYPVYPSSAPEELRAKYSQPTALSYFVPVRARRQIQYPLEKLGGNAPSERVLMEQQAFALNHINRKLIYEPKVTVNARIVVVGASSTGISFLETLAFCPHLRFNNLILVSPHGLPGDLEPDEQRECMTASGLIYDSRDYACMSLRTWVSVVYGRMTKIDRKRKVITVNGTARVPYDYLILSTGLQYQPVAPLKKAPSQRQMLSAKRLPPHRPRNMFCINDPFDAAAALHWLDRRLDKQRLEGKLIVYGRSLDAYACVQALLEAGVRPQSIVRVLDPDSPNPFEHDDHVETQVEAALHASGVAAHRGYRLQQWNDEEPEPRQLELLTFVSEDGKREVHLDCCALFAYQRLGVDFDCFTAVNDACLVFDGRLVIDANFHTNDVAIRAAGPVTKFQRAYHADNWSHASFNSKIVGEQLAHALLRLFDPTLDQDTEPPPEPAKLIPQFGHTPKLSGARLPGGYHYLHVTSPTIADYLHPTVGDEGRYLKTCTKEGSYFRLHLNQYDKIDSITCLSREPFPYKNYIQLYGLHQRLLNNLASRFKEKLVPDFFEFFNETWALAFYHDRFHDFRDELRDLLSTRPAPDKLSIEEQIRKLMEDEIGLSTAQRAQVKEEYARSGAKRALETRFLNYISYNYYHLPMYAKPEMV